MNRRKKKRKIYRLEKRIEVEEDPKEKSRLRELLDAINSTE